MKKAVVIEHVSLEIASSFDSFTYQFEKALGILMPAALRSLGAVPASMVCYLNNTADANDLILFNMLAQDNLLKKENNIKIKQYQIGNPEIMRRMTTNHAGAGLYLPLHVLVYEKGNGKIAVEYDLPSSQCAQFNNAALLFDASTMENNLIKLIQLAEAAC